MSTRRLTKRCENPRCGKLFQPSSAKRRFCSLKCSHASKELTLPLDDMIADFINGMRVVDLVEKYGFAEATIFEHLARAGRRFPPRPVAQQIRFVGHDVRLGEFASSSSSGVQDAAAE